jgi:uncharacterized membrane-anchored protein YjiN (DUF445 family)
MSETLYTKGNSGKTAIVASTLLIAVLLCYFLSSLLEPQYPWLIWVKSFSEAASVGAIADWFAVTALFRHPLGIPIPHTAIIARQRDRLARGLGDFIDRNFLSKEVLQRKIIDENISLKAIQWFSRDSSPTGLAQIFRTLARRSLSLLEDRSLLGVINQNPSSLIKDIALAPCAGKVLRFLVEADTSQEISAGLIIQLKNILSFNDKAIENFVGSKLPWYIPEFMHRPAFRDFLAKIRKDIDVIENEKNHPARQRLNSYLLTLADTLESDSTLRARGEKLKDVIVASPLIKQYLSLLLRNLHEELKIQIADPSSLLSKALEEISATFSAQILEDQELQRTLNCWLFDVASSLSDHSSINFSYLVQEVFTSWDTKTAVARIEEQVSDDLQFIRINGTLIGGLVGVALHACQLLLTSGMVGLR